MDNIKKFFEAVDVMVRMTEDGQISHEGNRPYMSNQLWLRDMSTVSLTVPRQVGKTSYINKRATCADLVIVHNHLMKSMYKESRATVVTVQELMNGFNRGRSQRGFNRVYVDEPRMVFDRRFSLDELYSVFSGECGSSLCANMFVLLGT